MKRRDSGSSLDRRRFLSGAVSAGALACLGCRRLLALGGEGPRQTGAGQKARLADPSGMTVEEVFRFHYGNTVPVFLALAHSLGRERFVELLTKASTESMAGMISGIAKKYPQRDLASFGRLFQNDLMSGSLSGAFVLETGESTDKILSYKFTECLPARIFREMNAADIGYALDCSPVDAMSRAFNPKMRGTLAKSLMKGDDSCALRYTLEA
jgi:hypothetical protein